MTTLFRIVCRYTPMLVIMAVSCPVWGDQGKELFGKQCASCHTIGGGDSGGPDLKGVVAKRPHEWLETVIMEPNKLTASKDQVQAELIKKYGYEMPNLGIGHDDALKIITYLGGAGGSGAETTPLPAGEMVMAAATPEQIALGKALFTGAKRFSKGGAACVACHPFNNPGIEGGNLARADLVASYEKMGEQGMRGALKALKFPTMKWIYADRSLTDEEAAALIAFYQDVVSHKGAKATPWSLPAAGAAIFAVFLIVLTLYKRRIG